jgi:hypothetical protein
MLSQQAYTWQIISLSHNVFCNEQKIIVNYDILLCSALVFWSTKEQLSKYKNINIRVDINGLIGVLSELTHQCSDTILNHWFHCLQFGRRECGIVDCAQTFPSQTTCTEHIDTGIFVGVEGCRCVGLKYIWMRSSIGLYCSPMYLSQW